MDKDGIVSMGLYIDKMTNLPSWAKAVQIVRAERKKDIVSQSLALTVVAVNAVDRIQKTDEFDNSGCSRPSTSNFEGTFLPKFLSRGMAKNYLRWTVYDRGANDIAMWTFLQRNSSNDEGAKQNHLTYIFPPQYLASNPSGVDYDRTFLSTGKNYETVDMVSFIPNRGVDVDGSNGGSKRLRRKYIRSRCRFIQS